MDGDGGTPKGYRKRAAEVRAEAGKMTNAETNETKATLLKIATIYERLADALDGKARRISN